VQLLEMDLWLTSQSKIIKNGIDKLAETSSKILIDVSPAGEGRRVRKYQTDFLIFSFNYQLVNGEKRPQCAVGDEVDQNNSFHERNLCRYLTSKHNILRINN
jgi:hypothetical protein